MLVSFTNISPPRFAQSIHAILHALIGSIQYHSIYFQALSCSFAAIQPHAVLYMYQFRPERLRFNSPLAVILISLLSFLCLSLCPILLHNILYDCF